MGLVWRTLGWCLGGYLLVAVAIAIAYVAHIALEGKLTGLTLSELTALTLFTCAMALSWPLFLAAFALDALRGLLS